VEGEEAVGEVTLTDGRVREEETEMKSTQSQPSLRSSAKTDEVSSLRRASSVG